MRGVQKGARNTAYQGLGSNQAGVAINSLELVIARFKGLDESSVSPGCPAPELFVLVGMGAGAGGEEGGHREAGTLWSRSLIAEPVAGGPVIPGSGHDRHSVIAPL